MGLLSSIGKGFVKVMDTATTIFAHPIKAVEAAVSKEKTISQLTEAQFAQPVGKQIGQIALATIGYGAAVVGGAAAAARVGAVGLSTAAKALIPATTKGKVIAAIAAPVVVGVVSKQPVATAKAIANAPSALANVGANVADLATNPSLENVKKLVSENPVIVGGAAAAVAVAGAYKILPAIATAKQTGAIEEQTKAIEAATGGYSVIDKSGEFGTLPYTPAATPPTPQTQKVTGAKTSPRAKRRASKPLMQNITQKVSVLVNNRSSSVGMRKTENYINTSKLNKQWAY